MLVHDYLVRSAAASPGRECLLADGRRWTYGELELRARRLSHALRARTLQKGDRVVIFMDNSAEAVVGIFGTLLSGGCMVVVHTMLPPEKLAHIVNDSACAVVLTTGLRANAVRQSSSLWTVSPQVLLMTGVDSDWGESLDPILESGPPGVSVNDVLESDLAAIIYTSGSTGKPKGVMLTHGSIDFVSGVVEGYLHHSNSDRVLCLLQLSFGYGLLQLLVTFRSGGFLMLEKGFGFPFDIVRKLREERITGFAGVPTLFAMLLQLRNLKEEGLESVRYITNAAAGLPPAFVAKILDGFPSASLYLMHGLTECLRTTFLPPGEVRVRPDSVGKGMPGVTLFLADESGSRLPVGSTGELAIQGPNLMKGYWNDPEGTARVLRPDPDSGTTTLYCGDIFRSDADGNFYFVSRKDDVVKIRGEKVAPVEIENVLYTLPQVSEVRALGMPHPVLGSSIRVEIVLKEGESLTPSDVKLHCRRHLEEFKIPHDVAFVKNLPKTAGGKIKRTSN